VPSTAVFDLSTRHSSPLVQRWSKKSKSSRYVAWESICAALSIEVDLAGGGGVLAEYVMCLDASRVAAHK